MLRSLLLITGVNHFLEGLVKVFELHLGQEHVLQPFVLPILLANVPDVKNLPIDYLLSLIVAYPVNIGHKLFILINDGLTSLQAKEKAFDDLEIAGLPDVSNEITKGPLLH